MNRNPLPSFCDKDEALVYMVELFQTLEDCLIKSLDVIVCCELVFCIAIHMYIGRQSRL